MPYRFNHPADLKVIGQKCNPANDACITRFSHDGRLMASFWYSEHQPGASIRMHVERYQPNWLNRDFLYVAFGFPFLVLKVNRAFGFMSDANAEVLNLAAKLGFRELCRVPGAFTTGDLVITCMDKCECKWLNWEPKTVKLVLRP